MADWYVGQKVVCVDGEIFPGYETHVFYWPVINCVYTIREIFIDATHNDIRFRLEELKNPVRPWSDRQVEEVGFAEVRFRPTVNQNTDISELEAILDRVNNREAIDA